MAQLANFYNNFTKRIAKNSIMAERNIVRNLEEKATDGNPYSHRNSGWRDL